MSDDDIRDNQILDLQDTVNHLKERISELEKWQKEFRNIEDITEKYKQSIEELREQMDSLFNSVRFQRIENLEEVLREFIDLFWSCESEGLTHEEDLTYEQKYETVSKLAKKLDVGSARQTVKKQLYSDWDIEKKAKALRERLDSGGEKETTIGRLGWIFGKSPMIANSKPPEHPSLTQEDIDRLVKPFEEPRENDLSPIEYAFKSGQEYEREREDFPERVEEIKAMDRMIESDLGIKAITIKGNLYWMPKGEANDLISEFVKKLGDIIKMLDDPDDEVMVRELKEEYEEKLK